MEKIMRELLYNEYGLVVDAFGVLKFLPNGTTARIFPRVDSTYHVPLKEKYRRRSSMYSDAVSVGLK